MSDNQSKLCRIVAPEKPGGGVIPTIGTQVLLPSGEAIPCVYKVEIIGEAGDVWRAKIHCFINPPDFPLLAEISTTQKGEIMSEELDPRVLAAITSAVEDGLNRRLGRLPAPQDGEEDARFWVVAKHPKCAALIQTAYSHDNLPGMWFGVNLMLGAGGIAYSPDSHDGNLLVLATGCNADGSLAGTSVFDPAVWPRYSTMQEAEEQRQCY